MTDNDIAKTIQKKAPDRPSIRNEIEQAIARRKARE